MSAWDDENRWYARLMKLAHELAMEGRGEEAQDLCHSGLPTSAIASAGADLLGADLTGAENRGPKEAV